MNKISQSQGNNTTNSASKEQKFSPRVHIERQKKKKRYSKEISDALAEQRI